MRPKLAGALMVAAAFAALGALASAQDRPQTAISDIRQETAPRSTRIVIECTGPLAYTYYSPDPLTLVIDIPEVDASKVPARINVGTREVESLRVTTMARADGRGLARLEVRLASLVPYQIYSKDKALNVVFERPGDVGQNKPLDLKLGPKTESAKSGTVKLELAAPAKPEAAPRHDPPAPAPAAASVEPASVPIAQAPAPSAVVEKPAAPRKGASGSPASRILAVNQEQDGGQLAIAVRADGALHYQDFFLGNPDRLVVDFKDVVSRAPVKAMDVQQGPVRRVRLAQFSASAPKVARLVVDLQARAPYRIVEGSDGLKIVFGEGQTPAPAPLAALKAEAEPEPIEPLPAAQGVPVPVLPLPALPEPQLAGPPKEKEGFGAKTVGPEEKKYTGDLVNLDFKEGDILDIFRLFSDISGLNIVVNPGVSGKVTLKLNQVPWDQALDLILKANNLGYTREDNVIRIARLADLQREEQDARKLQEEQELAGTLVTWRKALSYHRAEEVAPTVLKAVMSPRGSVILDKRSNMIILTDLPDRLEKAKDLIADLDQPTAQVEIEARIVVTSRNFTRDVGVQWGFLNQKSAAYGNTTDRSFPNAVIVNGGAVPSTQGLPADQGGLASNAGIGSPGRGYAVNLPAAAFTSAIGISLGNIVGNFNIDAALTALERQGRGRILSTPKVTTQNNQAAEIKQGVQIPIQTVANNTVTVSFKDAVLTLQVTPQITEANTVILGIVVENNTPDFANRVNGIPPINTQSAKTNVLVQDGSTTVIGGIYQSNEQTTQNSTPFFAHIPLLGALFKNRFLTSTNNELLLFVTPRIIKG